MKHSMTLMLALAVMVAACGEGAGTPSAESGAETMKIFYDRRGSAHKTLDPPRQFDSASADIIMNVYDTLLEYHYLARPYRLVPNLVRELPEKQEDGKTYVFRLRKGIRFHDDACFETGAGRELVADDAIYSIQRFADANVNIKSWVLLAGFIRGLDDFREKSREVGKSIDYAANPVSGLRKIDSHLRGGVQRGYAPRPLPLRDDVPVDCPP